MVGYRARMKKDLSSLCHGGAWGASRGAQVGASGRPGGLGGQPGGLAGGPWARGGGPAGGPIVINYSDICPGIL